MRKTITKLLGITILGFSLFHVSILEGSASTTFSVKVNGQTLSTPWMNQDGRLLVPAVYFQNLGASVTWDANEGAVLVKKDQLQLTIPSGESTAYIKKGGEVKAENLSTTTLDKPKDTYIPLRYVAEKIGYKVSYDERTSTVHLNNTTNDSKDNLYWLYQITEAEAGGESYEGKVAVAASILNRVESSEWPNSIKEVIFQVVTIDGIDYYQFSPVKDKRIYNVEPTAETISAVQEALKGKDPGKGAVVFYNPDKTENAWVRKQPVKTIIGNHIFAGS